MTRDEFLFFFGSTLVGGTVLLQRGTQSTLVWFLVACLIYHLLQSRTRSTLRLYLVGKGSNKHIVLEGRVSGTPCLFLLDTGYAGAPVLSSSYLSLLTTPSRQRTEGSFLSLSSSSVQERYVEEQEGMKRVTSDDRNGAVLRFLSRSGCHSFTSGCTMRLMGIGATMEQQADMLMCPLLEFRNGMGYFSSPRKSNVRADVLVTNDLPGTHHILTMDYLLHSSPCLLWSSSMTLELNMERHRIASVLARYTFHELKVGMMGGAFLLPVTVGGIVFHLTLDTGAPGPLCIKRSAFERGGTCRLPPVRKKMVQKGVHGETICSEVISADVELGPLSWKERAVFLHDTQEPTDGFVGWMFLRGFDWLFFDTDRVRMRNHSPPASMEEVYPLLKEGGCGAPPGCAGIS